MKEPWAIPESWRWTEMGEIARVVGGGTPDTKNADYFGGDIAWLTPADLSGYAAKRISRGARNLTRAGLENSGAKLMPRDTVLFTSRAPIGYVAIAEEDVCTNQGFKSFVLRQDVLPDFIYYYLQHAKRVIVGLASGTTFLEISSKNAARIPVPVAPTREQQRIVDLLEELLTDIDVGVATLARVQEKLRVYRASVLKAALEGSLTADWRAKQLSKESASELLPRILAERRRSWEDAQAARFNDTGKVPPQNWRSKYKQPAPLDTTTLPRLPDGWIWVSVEQISSKVVDGVHKKPLYVPDGVPFVTVRNLTAGRGISFEKLKYVSPEDHAQFMKRADPERGDVLVSKDGTLGVVRVVETDVAFSIFVSVALVKPVIRGMSAFLGLALSSPQVQSQMVPKGSGLEHIHLEDLREDCIPLPPLNEQEAIVDAVENQLSVIDHLESELAARRKSAQALRQAVLRHAFTGELVPQDPNDEPASDLLGRIVTEREARVREASKPGSDNGTGRRAARGRRPKVKQVRDD